VRRPHENVATVLVDPRALEELELLLMTLDLRVWPVQTAPICVDGRRQAFQIRRRLIMSHGDAWVVAADWVPIWVGFGPSWQRGDDPLPWAAHQALWDALDAWAPYVRFKRRLGGVSRIPVPEQGAAELF
jgi:hypothetical protein